MVQRQNPLQPGDYYQREGTWPRNERFDVQDNRFVPAPAATPVHSRTQTIEDALKECVGIPFKEFGLIVRLDTGEDRVYSSPALAGFRDKIFTEKFKQDFRRSIRKASAPSNPYPSSGFSQDVMFNDFDADASSSTGYNRKHSSSGGSSSEYGCHVRRKVEDSDDECFSAKKRRFPNYRHREESNDDTPVPARIKKTQQLRIGDAGEVEKFYHTRFKDMQQSSCKVMGKAFVKLIEPKKQTHHPYTKGDGKAPPWWPKTTGDHLVRHKEPDHLLKPERIRLLIHILRMVVEPANQQHPSIEKFGLNVRKLEEVTMEAMNNWFNDKEHPDNAQKKPFLKEIFKIARAEEKYKNGEIDGSTYFSVMYGEQSGTEDSDNESDMKPEGNEDEIVTSIAASMPSPDVVSPTTGHNPHMLDDTMRMRLPMRQSVHNPMEEQQPQYNDFGNYRNMGFHPQSPGIQDRRSFVPTASYSSPQPQLYNNWSMVSNSGGQSFYTTSPQQNLPPSSGPYLPLPNAQPQMLPPPQLPSYDGLPSGRYDTSPGLGSSLRTGSIGHPHPHPQHMPGFENFMQEHGFQQHDNDLKDEHNLHHHQ
ncbi:uncharacterized protein LY89DRAFT_196326 [Mollisia scopiformis]|uniref:Subtelomeric hrmA-associated cluster protein AFUB-079030/YDR124W-like helical bundle domain-containing protein n=1 Tax=Mollisia scopiformis TaxID=149040 RepID=A0A194WYX0_MOLSC|nr:uncharacterized protein LY89DRAFT_196326 [Mollisia scopiformis]KUJ12889.1 hypothetical protein LY89DRAFT_196326 [Mollisia scopiformis]